MKTSFFRSLALLTTLSACFGESPVPTGPNSALARFGKTAALETTLGPGGYLASNGGIITTVFLGGDGQYRTEIWGVPGDNFVGVTQLTASGTRATMQRLAAGEEIRFKFLQRELVNPATGDYDAPGATLWSGDPSRNSDNRPHTSIWMSTSGCYIVGFEETLGGGDEDYNDATFEVCLGDPDNNAPIANAGADQMVPCTGFLAGSATLNASGSSDPDGDALTYTWKNWQGHVIGSGPTISVTCGHGGGDAFLLVVDDGRGGTAVDTVAATAVDTDPPVIQGVSLSATVLEPANKKMVQVFVDWSAVDLCTGGFGITCRISSVTSNEPDEGDIEITGEHTINLRAQRLGTGSGRIYTITVTCTDAFGNAASRTATVTVPKGKG